MTLRKSKPATPLYFKEDLPIALSQMNGEIALNLRYLENLIERVQKRYPLLDKVSVSLIIREIFKVLREIYFSGETLIINNFIALKLRVFWRRGRPNTQSIITTPADLK